MALTAQPPFKRLRTDGYARRSRPPSPSASSGISLRLSLSSRSSQADTCTRTQIRQLQRRLLALLPEQARPRRRRQLWPRRQRPPLDRHPGRPSTSRPRTREGVRPPLSDSSARGPLGGEQRADPGPCGGAARSRRFDTQDGLYDLAWSECHENQIATGSGDGSVKLWDVMVKVRRLVLDLPLCLQLDTVKRRADAHSARRTCRPDPSQS